MLEVAKGNFAPEAYHSFIGFEVAAPLLDRAFRKTYGLALADLFADTERTISSYRRAVSKAIPAATRVAWAEREHDIEHAQPGITRSKFVYLMNRSSYEREWGKAYDRPTMGDRIAAEVLKLVPPIGPLRALHFRMPTPQVEKLFTQSFDRSVEQYNGQVDEIRGSALRIPNINYDLGEPAKPGVYGLQDETYALWLHELVKKQFETVTPEVREEFLTYFKTIPPAFRLHDKKTRERFAFELNQLQDLLRAGNVTPQQITEHNGRR